MFIAELYSLKMFKWIKQRKWISYPIQLFLLMMIFLYGLYLGEMIGFLQQRFDAFTIKISSDSIWYFLTDRFAAFRGKFIFNCAEGSLKSSLVAISILLLAELSDSLQAILSSSGFQWLGKHSFALYLLHTIFQSTVLVHVKIYFSTIPMMDAGFLRIIIAYVINFLALIPVCLIFTRVFDQGSVHIGRYMTSGLLFEHLWKLPRMISTGTHSLPRHFSRLLKKFSRMLSAIRIGRLDEMRGLLRDNADLLESPQSEDFKV